MLPFGVTIPATVPQGSEIPEGLMNNPVYIKILNDITSAPTSVQHTRHTKTGLLNYISSNYHVTSTAQIFLIQRSTVLCKFNNLNILLL